LQLAAKSKSLTFNRAGSKNAWDTYRFNVSAEWEKFNSQSCVIDYLKDVV